MSVFRHGWGGLRVTPIIRCQACDPLPDSSASPQLRPCHITPRLHFRSLQNNAEREGGRSNYHSASHQYISLHVMSRLHHNASHSSASPQSTTAQLSASAQHISLHLISRLQLTTAQSTSRLQLTSQQRNAPQFSASQQYSASHISASLFSLLTSRSRLSVREV